MAVPKVEVDSFWRYLKDANGTLKGALRVPLLELITLDLDFTRDIFAALEDVGHCIRELKCIANYATSMKNDGHGQRGEHTCGYGW